jgi:hypothetical protein
MAEGVAISVEGGPELRRRLKGLEADLRDLTAVHRDVGNVARAAIAAEAPNDSGRLAASLKVTASRTRARVKSRLVYAPVIYYGWHRHNIAPNHFGSRAVKKADAPIRAAYDKGISSLVRKAERR